jgi:AraC-like DNA-binding protein
VVSSYAAGRNRVRIYCREGKRRSPGVPGRGREGRLPHPAELANCGTRVECIEEHLDANPTLEQLSAVAHLSTYHFAHQFKRATGLPSYQYVVLRPIERAQQLRRESALSLAEIAARGGFSDQSHLSRYLKHLVEVTPNQFCKSARIAKKAASRSKSPGRKPSTIQS